MLVRFIKGPLVTPADAVCCTRADGTTCTVPMPRQGILPRAAIHFVLETTLAWPDGVFGQIAQGTCNAESFEARPKSRRGATEPLHVQQSHALAECVQADQWGGASNAAGFAISLAKWCRRLGVPSPDISPQQLDLVRVGLRELGAHWRPLAPGGAIERTFTVE